MEAAAMRLGSTLCCQCGARACGGYVWDRRKGNISCAGKCLWPRDTLQHSSYASDAKLPVVNATARRLSSGSACAQKRRDG